MGNFYVNYTLRGPSQQLVAMALAGRSAIVTPIQNNCVVVFDEQSDEQHQEIIADLASQLSGILGCPLLAVLNHDDDILWYQLYLSGELVDEYNSSPDYFEGGMAEPEGGNAEKLCAAFGANSLDKVEDILRQPSASGGGYTFALERHSDLAEALGISTIGVGAGFNYASRGEVLSEDFHSDDLMKTKDLPPRQPLEDVWRKPVPGYYKVTFRANPKLKKSVPTVWMPSTWADLECPGEELSEAFHIATVTYRNKFKQLGFTERGFKKVKRSLVAGVRDNGGINYLDGNGCQYGQLIYNRVYVPSKKAEVENVIIAFTTIIQNEVLSCTNNLSKIGDELPNHTVIRMESDDVAFIHQQFVEHLQRRVNQPRCFSDLPALQAWFDANQLEIFEDKVRRGLWVRMNDHEVAAVRRKLSLPAT
jgi:hypothetical protein